MRYHQIALPNPAALTDGLAGDPQLVDEFREKVVQVYATGTWSGGNVIIEGSWDGTHWAPINGTGVANPGGFVPITFAIKYIRIKLGTGMTLAGLVAEFCGLMTRVD